MNKKAILFDADGVIIKSEMFSTQYQKDFNISIDDMLPFFKNEFQQCIIGKADLKIAVQPYLKKWKWTGDVDDFLLYWFKEEHKIDQQVIELIKNLKNSSISCYLATNQEKYRTEYLRKEMGFGDLFNEIFSSAEIGAKKPNQKFYEFILQALERKGISKKDILFTDDTFYNIEGAKNIGIDSCLYTDFEQFNRYIQKNNYN